MTHLHARLPTFDFTDAELFATGDPHAVWRSLRAHAPVYWHERRGQAGFWLVTKHADVLTVSRDAETFVSGRGVGLPGPGDSAALPGVRLSRTGSPPALNLLDPPEHSRLRRLVSHAFTPHAVARLEPEIRRFGLKFLDQIAPLGAADFVWDFASRVPLAVLGVLMGLPEEDWPRLAGWTSDRAPHYSSERTAGDAEREAAAAHALEELTDYLRGLFDARRREPRDDLISDLLLLEGRGQLTDAELMWFCLLLVGAGHETTRDALSGGVVSLLNHRAQLQRLTDDPSLLDTAVEEILRWTSPIIFFSRFVTRDTGLRGQPIRAGQRVLVVYPSANRDEEAFRDPDLFDIGRQPNAHVALGAGNHFCLGAALARLQLRALIPLVFERLPGLELTGTPERRRSNFNAGYSRVPVRFRRAGG